MAKSDKKKLPAALKPKKAPARKAIKKAPKAIVALSSDGPGPEVLDRLCAVVTARRDADPSLSHSARLLSRGTSKVAQKFGEEAVECLIEAVAGNRDALIAESADVLYHLVVLWVSSGVAPHEVWAELTRREGVSGIAEKAGRASIASAAQELGTRKIP